VQALGRGSYHSDTPLVIAKLKPGNNDKKEINLYTDTLRVIAIILVLFVHISAYGGFNNMREKLNLLV